MEEEVSTNVYKDDARAVEALNRMLDGRALRPPKLGNRRMVSAKLSQVAILGLKRIAKDLGYLHDGDGNVSLLLEAIGSGTLTVTQTRLLPRRL